MARYIDLDLLINKIEDTDWYHISKQGELVRGANSKDDIPLYKHFDIIDVLNNAPIVDVVPKSCAIDADTLDTLRRLVYNKCYDEYTEYLRALLALTPPAIAERAYGLVIRKDILLALEDYELSLSQIISLLSSSTPLEDIFHVYEDLETDHMDIIRACIDCAAQPKV